MRNSTLCYIEKDGKYLMLHRVKKENDVNRDKWIGIGGGFEEDESPEDCVLREALEETGLTLLDAKLRSVITFVIEGGVCEHMFLFKCTKFTGNITVCDEGILEWIPKEELFGLEMWEGDRIFLRLLDKSEDFFTLKLVYDASGVLKSAVLNGNQILR